MTQNKTSKNIFDYQNYRELLRDLYDQNKVRNKNFSYRYFARISGFGSASFLKRVIDGESELSEESILKIAKGFKLNKEEAHFFKHLVLLNQSVSAEEKQLHIQEIINLKSYKKIYPLSEAQYNLYAKWYFIPVRELVGLPGFREDPEWIAQVMIPTITPDQAQRALKELEALGLLSRDENGRLIQSSRFLATQNEVVSGAIAQWHKEMMKRASESIDTVAREKRDISSVTLRLSQENLQKTKEFIQKFRRELVELLSHDTSDSVYELNLQLFPLTQPLESLNEKKDESKD